jgi:hypothetical protein
MRNDARIPAKRQDGTALIIALVLLVSVTLLSLASVSNSVLEMNMANADEERMQTLQAADSAISMTITNFPTYVSGLGDGQVRCINTPGVCANGNVLDTNNLFESGDVLNVTLTLIGGDLSPIRIRDAGRILGTGSDAERLGAMDTNARRFEYLIESELDRRANNRGYAHLWRGFSRQVSTPSSSTSGDFTTCADAGGCS